jgi:ABC-type phosphate/phosphonate transport system substrate-binding protein
MASKIFRLGAVAYDPKVVTIWEGFKDWFGSHGFAFDYVLFSTYEAQVEAHLANAVDAAWNSPLAWIQTERAARARGRRASAIAMRDTDRDLASVVLVREDSQISKLADLRDQAVAVGAQDSPQATLIPLSLLADAGLEPGRDVEVRYHDILLGKHGDHIGGEREAAKKLALGSVDAACVLDANLLLFSREGTLPPGSTRVLSRTPLFDHCNFSVLDDAPPALVERFRALLLAMSYDDPDVRPLLELEGLKAWREGRTSGYRELERAVDRFAYLEPWLEKIGAQ